MKLRPHPKPFAVVPALQSVFSFSTLSDVWLYHLYVIKDPAGGTSQFNLCVVWTSAIQTVLSNSLITSKGLFFMHCYVKCLLLWILWPSTEEIDGRNLFCESPYTFTTVLKLESENKLGFFLLFNEIMLSNTFLASANKQSIIVGFTKMTRFA